MFLTDEEARKHYCPHMRRSFPIGRTQQNCQGASCLMAWRWEMVFIPSNAPTPDRLTEDRIASGEVVS